MRVGGCAGTRAREPAHAWGRAVRAAASAAVACALVLVPLGAARADPAADYMLHCRGCHGPAGEGAPGAAPSFRHFVARFLSVPGGREYLIRVPGTAQSELDDARTATLLTWLLYEFSAAEVPADFEPYSAAEVARNRRAPLMDVGAARRALVAAMDGAATGARRGTRGLESGQ